MARRARVAALGAAALTNLRHDFVFHAPRGRAIPRRHLTHVGGEAAPVCVAAATLMACPRRTPVRVRRRLVAVGSGAGLAYIPRSIAPSYITLASGRMAGATRPGRAPSEKGRLLWMDWTP